MNVQAEIFPATAPASSSPVGLTIIVPRVCPGCAGKRNVWPHTTAIIGSSAGPHAAGLHCLRCGHHMGWLSNETHRFIVEVIDKCGRPTEPIEVYGDSLYAQIAAGQHKP